MMKTDFEIGYIAGLMDGEGSINYVRQTDKRSGRVAQGCRLNVCVVANSNPLIISKVEQILERWGIQFNTRMTHPRFWQVDIVGTIDNKRKFLKIIYESLAGKKEQASLMLRFMNSRGAGKKVPVTESDLALLERVTILNRLNRLGTVETAPEPLPMVEEKIQSELFSDEESPAEMPGPALVKTA
jgi:hypothetical protein